MVSEVLDDDLLIQNYLNGLFKLCHYPFMNFKSCIVYEELEAKFRSNEDSITRTGSLLASGPLKVHHFGPTLDRQ